MLDRKDLKEHYTREEVKKEILKRATFQNYWRIGKAGHKGLYHLEEDRPYQLDEDYDEIVERIIDNGDRSLYWTLNFNTPESREKKKLDNDTGSKMPIEYGDIRAFSFGADIDIKDEETNVNDAETREALEKAAQFVADRFEDITEENVYAYFSGNGVYVLMHEGVFNKHLDINKQLADIEDEELLEEALTKLAERDLEEFCRKINIWLRDIEEDMHEEIPETEVIGVDAINNKNRVFKSLFSIHSSLDYACIPLDADDVKIDLEKASLPLDQDVIEKAKDWYPRKPTNVGHARVELVDLMRNIYLDSESQNYLNDEEAKELSEMINKKMDGVEHDKDNFPAIIQRVIEKGEKFGKSGARCSAILSGFLSGIKHPKGKEVWKKTCKKRGMPTSNIWESWTMPPNYQTLKEKETGFPHMGMKGSGLLKGLNVPKYGNPVSQYLREIGVDVKKFLIRIKIGQIDEDNWDKKLDEIGEIIDGDRRKIIWSTKKLREEKSNILPSKKDIKNWLKEIRGKNTEQTEQTELTEQSSLYKNSCGGMSGDINIDKILDQKPPIKKRLTGVVNDTFFLTTWIYKDERFMKVVLTSGGEIKPIKNKLKETRRETPEEEWEDLPKEEKEKLDYDYFKLNGDKIQFKHKIPDEPVEDLKTPTNGVLKYIKNPEEVPEKEELFDEITAFIGDYWDHYHDEWYDAVGAFIIHSYLIAPLAYTIYPYLHGEADTGKTTLQKAIAHLQYNGHVTGNATPPTVMRYSHAYQASINLEETDKESKERKNRIMGLFNTGQRKGGVYPITNTDLADLSDQITQIYSFNPKTFSANSVYGWVDSFKSRCLFLKCVRKGDSDLKNPDKIDNERREKTEDLRNKVAAYTLFNWKDIIEEIEEEREELNITGRQADKLALFSGIVKHFKGEEGAKKVKNRIKEAEDISGLTDLNPRDKITLEYLVKEFNNTEKKTIQVQFKKIAEYVNDETNTEPDDEYAVSSRGIGSKLRNYDLIRDESATKVDGDGLTCVILDKETLTDSLSRYNLTELRSRLLNGDTPTQQNNTEKGVQSAQSAQLAQSQDEEKSYDNYSRTTRGRCEECGNESSRLSVTDTDLGRDVKICPNCANELYGINELGGS